MVSYYKTQGEAAATDSISLEANAKINLTLDITGVRGDGYHTIDSVMHSVSLCDRLTITKNGGGLVISSNARYLPTDSRNVVHKAASALASSAGIEEFGADIYIKKVIPTRAGLGGGSADAAAALIGLNKLFSLNIPVNELAQIGGAVGADIPFCVFGGCARVTGIGEQIKPLAPLKRGWIVIAMPKYGCSTKEAFSRYDAGAQLARPDTDGMLRAVAARDLAAVGAGVKNVFEQLSDEADTERIKAEMVSRGAAGAALSGSGAAVFGIFNTHASAAACRDALSPSLFRCFVSRPAFAGVKIV